MIPACCQWMSFILAWNPAASFKIGVQRKLLTLKGHVTRVGLPATACYWWAPKWNTAWHVYICIYIMQSHLLFINTFHALPIFDVKDNGVCITHCFADIITTHIVCKIHSMIFCGILLQSNRQTKWCRFNRPTWTKIMAWRSNFM